MLTVTPAPRRRCSTLSFCAPSAISFLLGPTKCISHSREHSFKHRVWTSKVPMDFAALATAAATNQLLAGEQCFQQKKLTRLASPGTKAIKFTSISILFCVGGAIVNKTINECNGNCSCIDVPNNSSPF